MKRASTNGIGAALLALDVEPFVLLSGGLRGRDAGEVVPDVLVLDREEAEAAVVAARNIDDEVPFCRHQTVSAVGCQSSAPVHFSTWIRTELGFIP